MGEDAAYALREATFDDCASASKLLRRLGLTIPAQPAEARAKWAHLWLENPAVRYATGPLPPIGWVLEHKGEIVGFFGNIPLRYTLSGRALLVGNASMWGVERPHRALTERLASAYFEQRHADVLLVTTGIKPTGRLFARYGASVMPQRSYDTVLFWVLTPSRFLRAALVKKSIRLPGAGVISRFADPAVRGIAYATGHRPGRSSANHAVSLVSLADVAADYDALWVSKTSQSCDRLYANRSAADLRWHFREAEAVGGLALLDCRRSGLLRGYLALLVDNVSALGIKRARIADMLVIEDDVTVYQTLLEAAYNVCESRGVDVLEAIGLPDHVRTLLAQGRPLSRKLPTSPFHYKALRPELRNALALKDSWYPTLFDGDSSL